MNPITKKLESLAQVDNDSHNKHLKSLELFSGVEISLAYHAGWHDRDVELSRVHAALKVASEALERIADNGMPIRLAVDAQAEILKLLNGGE